jgi:hypothetical protein
MQKELQIFLSRVLSPLCSAGNVGTRRAALLEQESLIQKRGTPRPYM